MNVDAVTKTLREFAKRHKASLSLVGMRQSQLLELAAIVGVQLHYLSNGFEAVVRSPGKSREFVVKTSTRGHPAKYSSIVLSKGAEVVEAHMNLLVRGAHDGGIYCVDVGIVKPGSVPANVVPKTKVGCVANEALLSFVEAKRLAVYPMLLAQFVGIAHEIGLDPIPWTVSERRIRCPRWQHKAGASGGSSVRSSAPKRSGWCSTKARPSARWPASSISRPPHSDNGWSAPVPTAPAGERA